MKLSFKPFVVTPQDVTAESQALARWYESEPSIRRLWGIRHEQRLRVIVAIEPTLDNDDVLPAWFLNSETWESALQSHIGSVVQLELLREFPWGGIEIDAGSIIIADLFWRDATL